MFFPLTNVCTHNAPMHSIYKFDASVWVRGMYVKVSFLYCFCCSELTRSELRIILSPLPLSLRHFRHALTLNALESNRKTNQLYSTKLRKIVFIFPRTRRFFSACFSEWSALLHIYQCWKVPSVVYGSEYRTVPKNGTTSAWLRAVCSSAW